MKAVVMAGGEGARLRPLTCRLPKPLVSVGNRPILDHVLTLLARHGVDEALLTLHHHPHLIREHVGDGAAYGLRTRCYVEDVPLGTAGSVKNVQVDLDGTFIVISGDVLTDFDLSALVDFHRRKGAVLTVGLTSVDTPLEYGVVVCDRDGRVLRYIEKPSWGEIISDQVNAGIYVVEPEALNLVEAGRAFDFSRDLFPALLKAGIPFFGHGGGGYWCDVGNLDQYLAAHFDLLAGRTSLQLEGAQLQEKVWVGPGVDLAPGVELEGPLLLGPGCYLGLDARIQGPAVLGREVIVGGQASIRRSVIGDHSRVGRLAEVRGAVLGRSVRLQTRASVYDGAVLADEVRIGEETTIKPGVKIWPGRSVAPETVLADSLVWGQGWGYGLFGETGIVGTVNVDLRAESAARLGAVFGASQPGGATIVVGADPAPSSRLLREAFIAGLGLAGCAVTNVGELPSAVVRHAVRTLGAAGGGHVGVVSDAGRRDRADRNDRGGAPPGFEGGNCCFRLFDSDGLGLARPVTRRLERGFGDEDFRRAASDRLGEVRFLPGMGEAYLAHLEQRGLNLARKGLVVAGAYRHPWFRAQAGAFWRALDVAHVALPPFGEIPLTSQVPASSTSSVWAPPADGPAWPALLGRRLREIGAMFAFEVDESGESLTLIDNGGRLLNPAQTWFVLSSVAIARKGTPLVVPSNLPRAVADRLAELGAVPVPGRAWRPDLEADMREAEKDGGPALFRQSEMVGDALLAAVGLLDYLHDTEETVAGMVDHSPLGEWVHRRVACPWEAKGRVMRCLLEDESATGGDRDERGGEGFRVTTRHGRVLILPDASRPAFHVYSEAASAEAAEELAGDFAERVRTLADREDDTGIPPLHGQS